MTQPSSETVPVTQEARDAAADLFAVLHDVWPGYSACVATEAGCDDEAQVVQAFARFQARLASTPTQDARVLREALEWYAEQARLCRLVHSEGDAGRNALSEDGGQCAREALRLTQSTPEAAPGDDYEPDEVDGYLAIDHGPDYFKQEVEAAPAIPEGVRYWRHKARGSVYAEIGTAELQAANGPPEEGALLTIYRGEDGKLWARRASEFGDGRFERITSPETPGAEVDTAFLSRDLAAQIEREGAASSYMIRAGLLRDILAALSTPDMRKAQG